jgi:hypothetical protein
MNILFVNMPFSYLWPSLGVSLLKGNLERLGHRARVEYLNGPRFGSGAVGLGN